MDQQVIRLLYEAYLSSPHIATDSRRIEPGSIFFALHGDNFDGNRFAASALEAGASVAVVDDPKVIPDAGAAGANVSIPDTALGSIDLASLHADDREEEPAKDNRYILVPDTLRALQLLAAYHRRELGLPIVAITGSNGKTTTKELIGRTLSQKYRTSVTQGNLNNHIGVPLTLLAITPETDLAVVEMGANHQREIEALCAIAQPDFGVITNIGRAHLEGFGGPQGVRKGKGELFDYLAAHGGTAFYLNDDTTLREMAAERPALQTVPYSASALQKTESSESDAAAGFVTADWDGRTIRTQLVGDYNLNNMAAAIAIGTYFGVDPEAIVRAIESYTPDNNRSQKQVTAHNTLILDAYNANPSSMQAALENFSATPSSQPKAVILGDMRELGEYAAAEHARIVDLMLRLQITEAYLVGDCFAQAGANTSGYRTFADAGALHAYLEAHPLRDRSILIKGSRGIMLEKVVDLL